MDRDTLFGKIVVLVLAIAVLATLVDAAASRRKPQPEPRLLTVTADAYEEAEPDVVRISLGMKAVRPTPQEAAAQVGATVAAVKNRLAKLGVTKDAIETSELYLGEALEYNSHTGSSKRIGYKAYYWLRVTLKRDTFPKLAQVINASVAGGVTSLSGLTWEMEDDTALRASALRKATEHGRVKADAMAKAAGARIVGVYHITDQYSEDYTAGGGYEYMNRARASRALYYGGPVGGGIEFKAGVAAEAPPGASEPPITAPAAEAAPAAMDTVSPPEVRKLPGKLRLSCSVEVAFLIR